MAENKEMTVLAEEIKTLATQTQAKMDEVVEGKADKATVEKMSEEFGNLSEKYAQLESEQKSRIDELELTVSKFNESSKDDGELSNPEYKKAFDAYLRNLTPIDEDMYAEDVKNFGKLVETGELSDHAVKSLVVGSNPAAGYLAPVGQSSRMIERIRETSPMRQVATVENTSFEAMEFLLDDDDFVVTNVGEVDSRTDTDNAELGIVTIPTHEIHAMPKASQKMLDDSIFNLEAWINKKVADKISRTENAQFINGTGVKQARGITDYDDWATPTVFTAGSVAKGVYERNALESLTSTGANTFTGDDLINLQATLLAGYNGVWGMNRLTWAQVLRLKDGNDQYLLNPAMLFSGSQGMQLLGNSVVMMNDLPVVDGGNYAIVYGDFKEGYTILDRIGIRILRDPYTTKGFVKFYTTKRTGGAVTNYQAIKRLKIASS